MQACREILVGCADYLITSETAYDRFLLAPPDDIDRLESIVLPIEALTSRRWMQPPSAGASLPREDYDRISSTPMQSKG